MKKPRAPREFLFVILRGSIGGTGSQSASNQPFQWRQVRNALAVAGFLAFVMQFVEYKGWIAGTEGHVLDLFLNGLSAEHTQKDVILIKIDNAAYSSCFRGTTPLDAELLRQIVLRLISANRPPGVLGVDIITDSPNYQKKYQQIASEVGELGTSATPVVWAAGADVSITRSRSFWPWRWGTEDELLVQPTGVLGTESLELPVAPNPSASDPFEWGLPMFPPDEDLRLRRFPRKISVIFADGRKADMDTWARKVAAKFEAPKIGEEVPQVLLSYSLPLADYPLLSLYDCKKNGDGTRDITPREESEEFKKFKTQADKAVLLLGGTFSSSGDFHETSQGQLSGLEINARAVQAELTDHPIREFNRLLMFALDTIIGFMFGMIFAPEQRSRVLTCGSCGVLVFGAVVTCFALIRGYVLLIFIGMALAVIGSAIQWFFAPRKQRIRALVWASLGMVLIAVVVSYLALRIHYYVWLSCVGVALGVNFHVIYEVYHEDVGSSKAEE
jgi:CHASE2 domain-containing sensor protein